MILQAIASGSNGNAFYIRSLENSILIDDGISRKRILEGINFHRDNPRNVKYILITHAHSDHVSGLPVLHSVLDFNIVATQSTINEIRKLSKRDLRYNEIANNAIVIKFEKPLKLGSMHITAFEAIHDIDGAAGFSIYFQDEQIMVCYTTDNQAIIPKFKQTMRMADFIIIESNYDIEMLKKSNRPIFLKKRIVETHLSNSNTIKTLEDVLSKKTKGVFFAHLSGDCNKTQTVIDLTARFKEYLNRKKPDISSWESIVCSRYCRSHILKYEDGNVEIIKQPQILGPNKKIIDVNTFISRKYKS